MKRKKKINIRSLEVKELEKVFGGGAAVEDIICYPVDVFTNSDEFGCGTGEPPPMGPTVPLKTCRYPYWVCL